MAGPPPSLALLSLASWSCPSAHLPPYHFLPLSTILSSALCAERLPETLTVGWQDCDDLTGVMMSARGW